MFHNISLHPLLSTTETTKPHKQRMIEEKVLKNLKKQPGVFPLLPQERFYYIDSSHSNQLAYFTGNEIRITEDKYSAKQEINAYKFQYLLAHNDVEWSLYQFQYHTFTDQVNGAQIRKGVLELVPYDSSNGNFFKVSYLDLK